MTTGAEIFLVLFGVIIGAIPVAVLSAIALGARHNSERFFRRQQDSYFAENEGTFRPEITKEKPQISLKNRLEITSGEFGRN